MLNFVAGFDRLSTLKNLEALDLGYTSFDRKILSSLSQLSSLKHLGLPGCFSMRENYNNSTKSMHSLQVLKLDSLYFANISNVVQSLRAFSYLKHLYFRYNYVNRSIGSYELRHLRRLEGLFLDNSTVDWNFPQSIGALSSLKILSLSRCGLNDSTLPDCVNLKTLKSCLSWNEYEGTLPSCVANMTSLRLVDLSHNTFSGNIASSPLSKLTSLEYLFLSKNNEIINDKELGNWVPNFQLEVFGPNFPTWLLENNTRLGGLYLRDNGFTGPLMLPTRTNPNMEIFDVSNNKFNGHVPTNITSIFPNLLVLNMSTNMFGGCVPSSFGDLKSTEYLDLSSNNLSGTIPQDFVMGCFSLFFLKLSDNKLQGQIFPESFNLQNLGCLYLDSNEFSSTIPKSLSTIPLSVLEVSNNHLSGRIPTSVGNMTTLTEISLSNNQLEGPISEGICNLDLHLLDLSENNLCGSVPSCFNPSRMDHFYLNNNQLEGELSYAFYNCSYLELLDLRWNKFIGGIPHWIGNLSRLSIILLRGNHFEGTIPHQFCEMDQLSMIDLSFNFLSVQIPPCLGNFTTKNSGRFEGLLAYYSGTLWSYMSKVELEKAYHVTFQETGYFILVDMPIIVTFMTKRNYYTYKGSILNYMSGIDLSSNILHGEIPDGLGNLSEIHSLNLSHNYLIGTIPETFSNLSQIESLDLSYNNLVGRIPSGLIKLNNLAVFNVAHNNLTGMIPEKFQFGTFDEGSYQGNPYLCGHPLLVDCTSTGSTPVLPSADDESEKRGFMDMEFFYISFIISYLYVVICIATVLPINPHRRKAWFHFIKLEEKLANLVVKEQH
ncbi:LRR receptor-like serine threonine- kinase GSO1 [Olea europaea subsp. europaea]|uniref:LRR receptor-like serine threonine- kinase GSO1 n=1 Tax=Olea europaea subsp. europaea TaxID=158383 RepID=A0A8S0PRM2_OLEEU|nr:LRR receptor-like serine threonine- kinase GSO1 [Olea europaea subsp. europaea]